MGFGQTDGDINQYYGLLDTDLNTLLADAAVDANLQASQEYYSIVHNQGEQLTYYVYSDNRDFANNIYVQQFDLSGQKTWEDAIQITEISGLPSDDNVIGVVPNHLGDGIVEGGGITILYNSGNFLGTKIYAISIDSSGNVIDGWNDNGNRLCNYDSDQYIESFIATSYGILATFKDNRSGSNDVYAQLISFNGDMLFDENGLIVADADNDQQSSSIAFSDGNPYPIALVCWEDFRLGTEYDIYCKYIYFNSPEDQWETLDEIELAGQSNTSGGNQTNPFVFSHNSNFLVAWEDSRNDVYTDIYFQNFKLQPDLHTVLSDGGELLCDADFDQLNPKIGMLSSNDSQDNYLIYWDDMRSSGKEFLNNVFAQSYTLGEQSLNNDPYLAYDYRIKSTYPNPFNPSISIDFSIDKMDLVKLSIYDIKGREIATLFQDYLNVGSYSKEWKPSQEISSGMYFVRLESLNNNTSVSEKIMFIK